jgi:myxalamid-type polyketide synthase MxaE
MDELQAKRARTCTRVRAWATNAVANFTGEDPSELPLDEPLTSLGIGSREAVTLVRELEREFAVELASTLAWERPTIESISEHVADLLCATEEAPAEPARVRPRPVREPVAVIGMACRFPGADDLEAYWQLLREGRDAIREVDASHWLERGVSRDELATLRGEANQFGGFLDHIDEFDAVAFGVSADEAARMDPQQRLLLEVTAAALADAGLLASELAGTRTGVFVGASSFDFALLQLSELSQLDARTATGSALSILANRISYSYDLRGPSLVLDTACSSSLVAFHSALRSLQAGECERAIVAGVNVILSPAIACNFRRAGALAADGRCKFLDASADGFVRSEGVGVVILQGLGSSVSAQARVYAEVRGSAVNQDGRSNGLMAPNLDAQVAVLNDACDDAAVTPSSVAYVEAHGTGTLLGDPIEARGLGKVYGADRSESGLPCLVGSVKTNLGHLEAAAGIVGVIKLSLALHHRWLPPSLHLHTPNPHVALAQLGLEACTRGLPWPELGSKIAGVSSFGFGGTNAHVLLQAHEPERDAWVPSHDATTHVLALSASSRDGLLELSERYASYLSNAGAHEPLEQICSAAALRHDLGKHRRAVCAPSHRELAEALRRELADEPPRKRTDVVFVFSGTGSEWVGMARDLLAEQPVFRARVLELDAIIQDLAGWSVLSALEHEAFRFDHPSTTQPCLFVVQSALAALWRSWDVRPSAILGHSAGEPAAMLAAGALTDRDAARLILARSKLLGELAGSGMMAMVGLDERATERALEGFADRVAIAALNGPAHTVISGEPAALRQVLARLSERAVFHRVLAMDFAAHSQAVEPSLEGFCRQLADLRPAPSSVPLYSTVYGKRIVGSEVDASYWARNLRQPVRFRDALRELLAEDRTIFIELSPHPVLAHAIEACVHEHAGAALVLPSLQRGERARDTLLATLARLFEARAFSSWAQLYERRPMVSLPLAPLARTRHWFDPRAASGEAAKSRTRPARGFGSLARLPGVALSEFALAREHVPQASEPDLPALLPWAEVLDNVIEQATRAWQDGPLALQAVVLNTERRWPDDARAAFQLSLEAQAGELRRFAVHLRTSDGTSWVRFATGQVVPAEVHARAREREPLSFSSDGPTMLDVDRMQQALALAHERLPAALPREAVPRTLRHYRHAGGQASCTRVHLLEDARVDLEQRDASGALVRQARSLQLAPADEELLLPWRQRAAERLRYEERWLPFPTRQGAFAAHAGQCWLLLDDGSALARELARALPEMGVECQVVNDWPRLDDAALRSLFAQAHGCAGVLAFWLGEPDLGAALPQAARAAFLRASALIRSHAAAGAGKLWLFARDQQLGSDALVDSMLWGLARVASLECQTSFGGIVGVHAEAGGEAVPAIVSALAAGDGEDRWRIVEGTAYTSRLVAAAARAPSGARLALRSDASYLITGGTGGVGLALARWLASRGAGRLVLCARRPPSASARQALAELSEQGVAIQTLLLDVGDSRAVRSCIEALARDGRPLRGIFHAAGVAREATLQDASAELVDEVLRAKVDGAWNLHQSASAVGAELDYFVSFGSISAVWGSSRLSAYAAANRFLSAQAAQRRAAGLPALCVHWGWLQEGEIVSRDYGRFLTELGISPVSCATAFAAMESVLLAGLPDAVVARVDWSRFVPAYEARGRRGFFDSLRPSERAGQARHTLREALAARLPAERRELLLEHLCEEIASLLGRSARDVAVDEGLFQLGLDSLMAVTLRRKLDQALGTSLAPTALFEHGTVARLVEHLLTDVLAYEGSDDSLVSAPQATAEPIDELSQLSEDDLLARLEAKLGAA